MVESVFAQFNSPNKISSFSNSWILFVESGATFGDTDYKKMGINGTVRGGIEYYFTRMNKDVFNLRIFVGGQKISGTDDRPSLTSKDGIRDHLPPKFITDMYIAGLAASYSRSIKNKVFPFLQVGLSYLLLMNPKDENGSKLVGNSLDVYKKYSPVLDIEGGVKYLINDRFGLIFSGGIHITDTDYIDDVASGNNNDVFYTGLVGVSFSPFGPGDSDNDGILNQYDACPDEPEDMDGFEDDDGCPDYDNDFDGIPDVDDNCPMAAEDIDGFADSDGCPDPDNDLDGIPDTRDECPNDAEDKDGYLDQDGCPDPDNDNDGIPDVDDQCPNQPETQNGYEDQDGCPDQVNTVSINKITIYGSEIFYDKTATIKPEGIAKLNEALETIEHERNSKWRIEGHMDSQGSEQFIREMSFNRAEAVYQFLISRGISPSSLSVYGMSDDYPIADNTNEEGRNRNRRIEIIREN